MQVKALDTAPPVLTVQRILDDILASNQGIRMHSIEHALCALAVPCVADEQLIRQAAQCIRTWSDLDPESLAYVATQNSIDLVLLLTQDGPKYVLKQQTAPALRVNKMLYITNDFADLLLAKATKHKGKIHSMFNEG
ncbi:Uncharacterized protein SCF082_LOCUS35056, partial [Durusdinium trenchii]